MALKKQFELKPGSKQIGTEYGVSTKQTDTISKLIPKIKSSRKQRKFNEAKAQEFENYKKESKRDYPDFDQKTDSVVTTKGYNTNVIKAHNRMKAKLATLPKVSLKPGETVKRNFIPGAIDYNKEKLFKNRKTGEFTSKLMVKKNSAKILKKK